MDQFKRNFRPVKKYTPKASKTRECNWIVECSPKVRNIVRKTDRLFLDYGTVRFEDYIVPSRCFKCHGYSHVAKYCEAKNSICGYCAEEGHKYEEWKERKNKNGKRPKCAACLKTGEKNTDHSVIDGGCKAFLKAREELVRRTDYGA